MFPCFGVRVSVTFHLTCVHIISSSVSVTEWSPFGKKLLTRLTICFFFCILTICNFTRFGFEGWIWVLNTSVPDLCILFYLKYGNLSQLVRMILPKMNRVMRKPAFWFPTWSETNQAVQL